MRDRTLRHGVSVLASLFALLAVDRPLVGAAEISSAALSALGPDACFCRITNAGRRATGRVTVEIINRTGAVQVTEEIDSIAAGFTISVSGSCGINNPNRCRISGRFSKSKVHAIYCVTESTTVGICVPLR